MELIIDANILMSALISSQGKTFDLIFNEGLRLYAPEFLFEEIKKYKDEIIQKSKISKSEFDLLFSIICTKIEIVSKEEFKGFINKAKKITPDQDDTEYLALALKLNCPIWSNDKQLKKQNYVRIINTIELIKSIND